ncbi:hypothetical protein AV530_008989 [Patagioenas fasciata monilis]|uniref:Uncharacterized protein n=1 Tax=Patagioenas fasciata monilis TaxID=372326 RepID=A0A1V4L0D0_PATFA|nr:hypothetical protein AV530_008989 [Patagioenas fasciata monilis]
MLRKALGGETNGMRTKNNGKKSHSRPEISEYLQGSIIQEGLELIDIFLRRVTEESVRTRREEMEFLAHPATPSPSGPSSSAPKL